MFSIFKNKSPKDPLEVLPEYYFEGRNVVFQEVVTLNNGVSLQDSFKRSVEYFSDFNSFNKENSKTLLSAFVGKLEIDNTAYSFRFPYWKTMVFHSGAVTWHGDIICDIFIQFKEGRFRYTMTVSQFYLWYYDSNNGSRSYEAASVIKEHRKVFFPQESNGEERRLRAEARDLRSLIYHSTERPDEDW